MRFDVPAPLEQSRPPSGTKRMRQKPVTSDDRGSSPGRHCSATRIGSGRRSTGASAFDRRAGARCGSLAFIQWRVAQGRRPKERFAPAQRSLHLSKTFWYPLHKSAIAELVMQEPLQISFHNMASSEALESRVREHWAKVERHYDGIISARIVLEAGHRQPHKSTLGISISIGVPGREIVVKREQRLHRVRSSRHLGDQRGVPHGRAPARGLRAKAAP